MVWVEISITLRLEDLSHHSYNNKCTVKDVEQYG